MAVCKVAHTANLNRVGNLTSEKVNTLYRSEEALTTALMGYISEEALIAKKLEKLIPVPKKKRSAKQKQPAA